MTGSSACMNVWGEQTATAFVTDPRLTLSSFLASKQLMQCRNGGGLSEEDEDTDAVPPPTCGVQSIKQMVGCQISVPHSGLRHER